MLQATIDLPESLATLPAAERNRLIQAGMYEAIRARMQEIAKELEIANAEIQKFEQRYGVSFARFENDLLPTLDAHQAHEDYNDWFFWQSVHQEKQALLQSLRP